LQQSWSCRPPSEPPRRWPPLVPNGAPLAAGCAGSWVGCTWAARGPLWLPSEYQLVWRRLQQDSVRCMRCWCCVEREVGAAGRFLGGGYIMGIGQLLMWHLILLFLGMCRCGAVAAQRDQAGSGWARLTLLLCVLVSPSSSNDIDAEGAPVVTAWLLMCCRRVIDGCAADAAASSRRPPHPTTRDQPVDCRGAGAAACSS
jgi:hypothetical protein